MIIKSNRIGSAWIKYLRYVLLNGNIVDDDRGKIIEVPQIILEFENINDNDKIIKKYGDPQVIDLYSKKMTSIKIIPELNSSYGKRLYSQQGINQVDWLIKKIKSKPNTKAATISLLLPNDPGPRIPCLVIIDIKVRNNKLILTAIFRSQNVFNSYGNIVGINNLHKKISNKLKIPKGLLRLYVLSPHIYIDDLENVLKIVKLNNKNIESLYTIKGKNEK